MNTLKELAASPWFSLGTAFCGFFLGVVVTALCRIRARRDWNKEDRSTEREFWTWWRLCAIVLLIWGVAGFGTFFTAAKFESQFPSVTLSHTGTFGDTFGAVNSLFSALGVAGVAYALILQFREQRDARQEAAETKEHQTDLAMLSSIVHACSTLLESTIREQERVAQMMVNPLLKNEFESLREIQEGLQPVVVEYRTMLVNLLVYSQRKWGWKASSEEDRKPASPDPKEGTA
jgi:hypothetical protein